MREFNLAEFDKHAAEVLEAWEALKLTNGYLFQQEVEVEECEVVRLPGWNQDGEWIGDDAA